MNEHCIGKIELISYFTGDVNDQKKDEIRNHVKTCDTCRVYLETLAKSKDLFLSKYPEPAKISTIRKITPLKKMYALAASLVLLLTGTYLGVKENQITERIKGSQAIELFVLTSQNSIEKRVSPVYFTGEHIQFSYSSAGKKYFALLSIDGTGKIFTYFPSNDSIAMNLVPGAQVPLPSSIELDNYIGKELFVAIFSSKQFKVKTVSEMMKNAYNKISKIDSMQVGLAGCQIEKILIEKQPKVK